jgi:hypothetical protein
MRQQVIHTFIPARSGNGNHTLVRAGVGQTRQLIAGHKAKRNAGRAASINQTLELGIAAFTSYRNILDSPASGGHGFFNRVDSIDDVH